MDSKRLEPSRVDTGGGSGSGQPPRPPHTPPNLPSASLLIHVWGQLGEE